MNMEETEFATPEPNPDGGPRILELRSEQGSQQLKQALERSGGAALVVVHPTYPQLQQDKRNIGKMLASGAFAENSPWHVIKDRIEQFEQEVTGAVAQSHAWKLPVVALVASDTPSAHVQRETNEAKDAAVGRLSGFLTAGGINDTQDVYTVVTHPHNPTPLARSSDAQDVTPEALQQDFADELSELGLTKAVVVGNHLGGSMDLEDSHIYAPAGGTSEDMLQSGKSQDVITQLTLKGCVVEAVDMLKRGGIHATVSRTATYPQKLPDAVAQLQARADGKLVDESGQLLPDRDS